MQRHITVKLAVLSKREKSTVAISANCPVPHLEEVVVIFPKKNRHPKLKGYLFRAAYYPSDVNFLGVISISV